MLLFFAKMWSKYRYLQIILYSNIQDDALGVFFTQMKSLYNPIGIVIKVLKHRS